MFITNIDEVVPLLRSRLRDYITLKLGTRANARKIKCFVHNDTNPSMHFNHKNNDETVKCFSCGWSGDIFAVAAHIDNLPSSGPEWITHTIPKLCKELEIPIKLGELSPVDKERMKQYKICQDIFFCFLTVYLKDTNRPRSLILTFLVEVLFKIAWVAR